MTRDNAELIANINDYKLILKNLEETFLHQTFLYRFWMLRSNALEPRKKLRANNSRLRKAKTKLRNQGKDSVDNQAAPSTEDLLAELPTPCSE